MNTQDYFTAKKKLNEFLEANPQLKPLQAEVDLVLKKAGPNVDNRLAAFKGLIREWLIKDLEALKTHAQSLKGKDE